MTMVTDLLAVLGENFSLLVVACVEILVGGAAVKRSGVPQMGQKQNSLRRAKRMIFCCHR